MQKQISILLIEDEEFDVRRVQNTVKYYENNIRIKEVVSNGNAALDILNSRSNEFDLVIMDYQIAGALRGENLIEKIKSIDSSVQIIVITKMTINITNFEFANTLMQAGAFWYCTKYPGDIEDYIYQPTDFIMSIFNAYEKRQLEKERANSEKKLDQNIQTILANKQIIGESAPIVQLRSYIEKYARSDVNILISGPSGTGKELVAYNVHYHSKRKHESFVPINCGSLPQDLIESELFGYEKGSFTGAQGKKAGLFEIANKGTVFLDEVAELPLSAQVKLLRVIQDGELEKIGRTQRINVDVRIIAATNKDLAEEVKAKRFREDLYYRLNVVPIDVMQLSKRGEDVIILFNHFLEVFARDMGLKAPRLDKKAEKLLVQHEWPGNVRELKNVVQRILLNAEDIIETKDIDEAINIKLGRKTEFENFSGKFDPKNIQPLRLVEKEFRKKYITFVRNNSKSDAEASDKLGIAPPNYHRMSKELGIK